MSSILYVSYAHLAGVGISDVDTDAWDARMGMVSDDVYILSS